MGRMAAYSCVAKVNNMSDPCLEIERIVKLDTLVGEHSKKLDTMDQKLDVIIDNLGGLKNSKSFIGGDYTMKFMLRFKWPTTALWGWLQRLNWRRCRDVANRPN